MAKTHITVRLDNLLLSQIEEIQYQQQINRSRLINRVVAAGLKTIADNPDNAKASVG